MRWTAAAAFQRIGNYWHMAPEIKQARRSFWDAINDKTGRRRIDDVFPLRLRKKTLDQEMKIEFINGSIWQIAGSDSYDALRGAPPIGLVFSEWALGKPQAWNALSPMLAQNKGWAIFNTTPLGPNHAKTMHEYLAQDEDGFAEILTVEDTKAIDEYELKKDLDSKIALYGEELGRSMYLQEWYCNFDAPSDTALIPSHLANSAAMREDDPNLRVGAARIMGVDVARFGADRSVIATTEGYVAKIRRVFESIDTGDLAQSVVLEDQEFRADRIFIDAGYNPGVIDMLRRIPEVGNKVVEVNFGGASPDEYAVNHRSYMWRKLREWLAAGGVIPRDMELVSELSTPEYKMQRNMVQLESKDDMKKRGMRSPDKADALALCFAMPVEPRVVRQWRETEFAPSVQHANPLDRYMERL